MTIDRSSRVELQYRGYTIVAAVLKGQPTASISRADAPATKERFLDGTVPAAIEAAKTWIDVQHRNSAAKRRQPNIGTVQEYIDAFTARRPKDRVQDMLRAHVADGVLTATALAKAAGYDSYEPANSAYGKLGHQVADFIGLQAKARPNGTPSWITVLIEGLDDGDELSGHFQMKLHDEVKEALQSIWATT